MVCVCIQSVDPALCQHATRLGIVHKECNIQISIVAVSTFVTSWQHCKHPNIRICCQCKMPLFGPRTYEMSVTGINNNHKSTNKMKGYFNGDGKNSNFTTYVCVLTEGGKNKEDIMQ